ncbi:MAG: hypothetical protein UT64_C0041G0013 [Candidatus Falkowbacteria bacterium GW2011_GWF2_39_8]|uniref:Uncharacterized protein n=1 Tax=Candidatus Falkowbacteria bacterium GW2011_GWF2_39_8 TaxID=1618642 RepID=A0A0G0PVH0_9BACT|nr:MAG: hypothetical protein UT64_C0041G0013 [Candidatus Falkowbacteria bacterium GW2011_GWF2_39_8]
MSISEQEKFLKFNKVFSITLIVYTIVPILTLFGFVLKPELATQYNVDIADKAVQAILIPYCLLGGIGLLKLKRWAMYLVTVPAIISLFFTVLGFLFLIVTIQNGGQQYPNITFEILIIFLGGSSLYIYNKRNLYF